MGDRPFVWPHNARVAFVLGIAFEAWDRKKPTRGAAMSRLGRESVIWKADGKEGYRLLIKSCRIKFSHSAYFFSYSSREYLPSR